MAMLRNLFFLIGLLLLAGLGYYLFIGGDAGSRRGLSEGAMNSQQFLADIQKVKGLQIETEFLSDARFQSLQDIRQPLQQEPVGRNNPFDPLAKKTPDTKATATKKPPVR